MTRLAPRGGIGPASPPGLAIAEPVLAMGDTAGMLEALGATEVHDLWSESVGDTFRVFVGHCGPDPKETLVVTDANGLFGLTVDTVRLMQIPALVPSLLVVGVGYPEADTLIDTVRIRARDLTPTTSPHIEGSGRAVDFIDFLAEELRPWLRGRYATAAEDMTYFGHSLGGLFGVYSLLTADSTFSRYIISSPSLWWDEETIFDLEGSLTDDDRLHAEVCFGIGSLETDIGRRSEAANLTDGHPAKPPAAHLDMVDDLRRFVARLDGRDDPTLWIDHVELADEFHATVPGIVLSRALRRFHPTSEADDED